MEVADPGLPDEDQPQPQSQSQSQQGLSFTVAGIGLENINDEQRSWDSTPMLPPLLDGSLSLDFDSLELPAAPAPLRVVRENETKEERGRLLVHYVGGSLTFLLQIALLAWGVRQLRGVLARRRQMRQASAQGVNAARINSMPFRPADSPLFSFLSPIAVRKLVELENVSFLTIDVRHPESARNNPCPIDTSINIPETELRACLQLVEILWENRFPAAKQPTRTDLLVFVSTRGERAQRAATIAAELGFNGCCVLSGGIESLIRCGGKGGSHIKTLSRDAVAFLLLQQCSTVTLVDVRRYDERSLYGHIAGSVHVPVEELPKALAMESSDWEKNYHFNKIGKDDLVILHSRIQKRASWAAQLCVDNGMTRCYVYGEGACGWRLDESVLPYKGYELGDAPSEPMRFDIEKVNCEVGEFELRQKGLL